MNASNVVIAEVDIGRHGTLPRGLYGDVAALARNLQRCAVAGDMHEARQTVQVFVQRSLARRLANTPLLTRASVQALATQLDGSCGFAACPALALLRALL
jgi:hypothetical protein